MINLFFIDWYRKIITFQLSSKGNHKFEMIGMRKICEYIIYANAGRGGVRKMAVKKTEPQNINKSSRPPSLAWAQSPLPPSTDIEK